MNVVSENGMSWLSLVDGMKDEWIGPVFLSFSLLAVDTSCLLLRFCLWIFFSFLSFLFLSLYG